MLMVDKKLEQTVQEFKSLIKKIKNYNEAVGLMYWDLRTGAPKKGIEQRSEVIGTLSTETFKMTVSDQMKSYLDELNNPDHFSQLDPITKGMVREAKKQYDLAVKIPPERYQEYVILTSKAESVWEEAKHKSDFQLFKPYLEQIVEFQKEFIGYWGYTGNKYNALLDQYEPGITVEQLDQLFTGLREKIVPLVKEVVASPHQPKTEIVTKYFDPKKQKEFSRIILEKMGYDFEAGRLDDTVHPFCIGLNPGDVRVTNRYNAHDLREGIFGAMHEGGHALYEQNISPELIGTNLCDGTSMGIHESQSRFFENMIGRSKAFWERYFKDLVEVFPEELKGVSVEDFYFAVNESKPSLIRTESDELTYNLHIMIRYEIEKGLINGDIAVEELPKIWNEKMEEYLGIVPANDAEGVLQDVHWSGGGFGYFPSYSLGNLYAAQFEHAMRKDLPDYEELIRKGEFAKIKEWMTEKVHRHGKLLTPNEILLNATGESLNSKYLTDYLEKKFRELYRI
jgi:carboxypeptidase Taq